MSSTYVPLLIKIKEVVAGEPNSIKFILTFLKRGSFLLFKMCFRRQFTKAVDSIKTLLYGENLETWDCRLYFTKIPIFKSLYTNCIHCATFLLTRWFHSTMKWSFPLLRKHWTRIKTGSSTLMSWTNLVCTLVTLGWCRRNGRSPIFQPSHHYTTVIEGGLQTNNMI